MSFNIKHQKIIQYKKKKEKKTKKRYNNLTNPKGNREAINPCMAILTEPMDVDIQQAVPDPDKEVAGGCWHRGQEAAPSLTLENRKGNPSLPTCHQILFWPDL